MKKLSIIFSLVACMFAGNVFAQHISTDGANFAKDTNPTSAVLVINLLNAERLPAGIDMNILLPDGFDFKRTKAGKLTEKNLIESRGDVLTGDDEEEPNEEHSFGFTEIDGGINLTIYDANGGMFEKSSGVLVSLNITCAEDKEIGDYEGTLELLKMSDYDGPMAQKETSTFKLIVSESPVTVGIRSINADGTNAPVYNTAGQRVSRTNKGLYIQNGKKVVKK
jgi:hypothetical protein